MFAGGAHDRGESHAYAVSTDGLRYLIPQFESVVAGFGPTAAPPRAFPTAIAFAVPAVTADRRASTASCLVRRGAHYRRAQLAGAVTAIGASNVTGTRNTARPLRGPRTDRGRTEERYKASDTRLNRVVTLKVLPSEFSEHPEMKARLERDTRTISSLNHPQICALVDVGHQEPATDFLVTEYLDGETLAQRLARGPLRASGSVERGDRDGRRVSTKRTGRG